MKFQKTLKPSYLVVSPLDKRSTHQTSVLSVHIEATLARSAALGPRSCAVALASLQGIVKEIFKRSCLVPMMFDAYVWDKPYGRENRAVSSRLGSSHNGSNCTDRIYRPHTPYLKKDKKKDNQVKRYLVAGTFAVSFPSSTSLALPIAAAHLLSKSKNTTWLTFWPKVLLGAAHLQLVHTEPLPQG